MEPEIVQVTANNFFALNNLVHKLYNRVEALEEMNKDIAESIKNIVKVLSKVPGVKEMRNE